MYTSSLGAENETGHSIEKVIINQIQSDVNALFSHFQRVNSPKEVRIKLAF